MLGARRNSGNGGNGGNGGNDGKMIIIIIDYIGDGGNDIQRLDSTVEHYFLHGLAESTRKTYNSAKRRYSEFAAKHGLQQNMGFSHYQPQSTSYVNLYATRQRASCVIVQLNVTYQPSVRCM